MNRFSLGTKNKTLKYGEDGSLTLYLGAKSPGKEHEANWLPAPRSIFVVTPELLARSSDLERHICTAQRQEGQLICFRRVDAGTPELSRTVGASPQVDFVRRCRLISAHDSCLLTLL